ncbi:MAG TPA: helix-turn-helix domain-containing protein [Asanoa sp.]|jgi:AcrR family transcriptional regulator
MRVTQSTRARIQAVALELFTEQGYEKTSLREVAERLGVTKAALYYHFKSKDEIVTSLVDDRMNGLDEVIKFAEGMPADAASRRQILVSYADAFFGTDQNIVMRFFEQNQTLIKTLEVGQRMRDRLMRIAELLARPDKSVEGQLRAALSIFAIHSSAFAVRDPEVTVAERRKVALKVGFELLDRIDQA